MVQNEAIEFLMVFFCLIQTNKELCWLKLWSFDFSLGNFISTAEKIRLPDDCTVGYIIEALLEVSLTHTHLFHSHLENLQKLPTDAVLQQVISKTQNTSRNTS